MPRRSAVSEYLAAIGRKGGSAGSGAAKRRAHEHYQEMAARSAKARHVIVTVNRGGNWRLYATMIPATMTVLGTVTRGRLDSGALCRVRATGLYVQLTAGAIRTLPQRAVREALSVGPVLAKGLIVR